MDLWQWLPKESELDEAGMTVFRHQLLIFLIASSFLGALFLIPWAVSTPPGPTSEEFLSILFGIILALITYILRPNLPVFTSWVYVLGSLAWFSLLSTKLPEGIGFSLLPIPVLLAGLLLGPRAGFITGAIASFVIFLFPHSFSEMDMTAFWIALIILLGVSGMIAGNSLAQVDYWERTLVHEQSRSISQLQEQRGELALVVEQLDQATERLARANTELTTARYLAEEGRTLKERFAANVSHELRTPLNIVVGFAEIMHLSPESYIDVLWSPDLQGDIQELYRASQHLQSLVNDVLDLSRINAAQLPMFRESRGIEEIVSEAIETVAPLIQQRDLTYSFNAPSGLPRFLVDRTRIRQVMINLLNNAIRYTDEGSINVDIKLKSEEIIVSISDTGVGIPEEELERIFDEFTQAETGLNRRGGTGLGLALSRRFVEMHGGKMWAKSELGQGSTFYFSLPISGRKLQHQQVPQKDKSSLVNALDMPIIVVDPDPSMADMFSRYLGERVILGARDLEEAAQIIQEEHPQALIINLPPDIPEKEWLSQSSDILKEFDIPVFRCSVPSPSWLHHVSGFDDSLTKPISREMVENLIKERIPPFSVLLVDDDPGFVRLLTRFLEKIEGVAEIYSAYNGERGLGLAREAKPNLIFLDISMPNMDGFQVLEALENTPERKNMHIVAVTATAYGEKTLSQKAPYLTLTQEKGLDTTAVLQLLNNSLKWVRPDYTAREDKSSKA